MNTLKKFWKAVDGKKTVSGLALLGVSYLLKDLGLVSTDQYSYLVDTSLGIIGVGSGHKAYKYIKTILDK